MLFWNKHGVFEVAPHGMEHDISAKNAPLMSANASEHLERMLLLFVFNSVFFDCDLKSPRAHCSCVLPGGVIWCRQWGTGGGRGLAMRWECSPSIVTVNWQISLSWKPDFNCSQMVSFLVWAAMCDFALFECWINSLPLIRNACVPRRPEVWLNRNVIRLRWNSHGRDEN